MAVGTAPKSPACYATRLSHELRTPMQGIIGSLDIMQATIAEGLESSVDANTRRMFENLKDNIDAVKESSRRAIGAADNIVQAYELSDSYPMPRPVSSHEITWNESDADSDFETSPTQAATLSARGKRRRSKSSSSHIPPAKIRAVEKHFPSIARERRQDVDSLSDSELSQVSYARRAWGNNLTGAKAVALYSPQFLHSITHGVHLTNVRDLVKYTVNETISLSGKPESVERRETQYGQRIRIRARLDTGDVSSKMVEWIVEPTVPETIMVETRNVAKMISCVFHNAIKFTDAGHISVRTRFCSRLQSIKINIKDTGSGIDPLFQPELFKAFSREDDSTTRPREGLGLGLMIAKGLADRLGGDLHLVSADTQGPNRGAEFEMRIPLDQKQETFTSHPTISPASKEQLVPYPTPSEQEDCSCCRPSAEMTYFNASHFTHGSEWPHSTMLDVRRSSTHQNSTTEFETALKSLQDLKQPGRKSISEPDDGLMHTVTPGVSLSRLYDSTPATPFTPTETSDSVTPLASRRMSRKSISVPKPEPSFDRNLAVTHPLTFLVAEDNVINRKLLVNMLVKLGYDPKTQIYEAYDGADAVRQIEASAVCHGNRAASAPPFSTDPEEADSIDTNNIGRRVHKHGVSLEEASRQKSRTPSRPVDIILMDLWMPRMDGYQAAEKILQICAGRSQQTGPTSGPLTVPGGGVGDSCNRVCGLAPTIMAITADATEGVLERVTDAGMSGFMLKPFRVNDLERLIRDGAAQRNQGVSAWAQELDGAVGDGSSNAISIEP